MRKVARIPKGLGNLMSASDLMTANDEQDARIRVGCVIEHEKLGEGEIIADHARVKNVR